MPRITDAAATDHDDVIAGAGRKIHSVASLIFVTAGERGRPPAVELDSLKPVVGIR